MSYYSYSFTKTPSKMSLPAPVSIKVHWTKILILQQISHNWTLFRNFQNIHEQQSNTLDEDRLYWYFWSQLVKLWLNFPSFLEVVCRILITMFFVLKDLSDTIRHYKIMNYIGEHWPLTFCLKVWDGLHESELKSLLHHIRRFEKNFY